MDNKGKDTDSGIWDTMFGKRRRELEDLKKEKAELEELLKSQSDDLTKLTETNAKLEDNVNGIKGINEDLKKQIKGYELNEKKLLKEIEERMISEKDNVAKVCEEKSGNSLQQYINAIEWYLDTKNIEIPELPSLLTAFKQRMDAYEKLYAGLPSELQREIHTLNELQGGSISNYRLFCREEKLKKQELGLDVVVEMYDKTLSILDDLEKIQNENGIDFKYFKK